MPVSFEAIPSTGLLVPLFYAEMDNSQASYFENNRRALLIGLRLDTGTAPANKPIQVTRADQAKDYSGVGSQLARMVEQYKANNAFGELWCVAADAAFAAVAATGTATIEGTATEAGALTVYIAGQRVRAAVATGNTAMAMGASLAAAVGAATDLPVTGGGRRWNGDVYGPVQGRLWQRHRPARQLSRATGR